MTVTRRRFLQLAGGAAAAGAVLGGMRGGLSLLERLVARPAKAGRRPSFLMIMWDSFRGDKFTPELTPNLWRLFSPAGLMLPNAFTVGGQTNCSVAATLSGLTPRLDKWNEGGVGFDHLVGATDPKMIPPSLVTFPELLKNRLGYTTVHLTQNAKTGEASGFGDKQWSHHELIMQTDPQTFVDVPRLLKTMRPPFFVYLHYMGTHHPYGAHLLNPAQKDLEERFQATFHIDAWQPGAPQTRKALLPAVQRDYEAAIRDSDDHTARLAAAIAAALPELVVLFLADHGEMFGEQERPDYLGHPGHLRLETARIPLALRGPGIPSGVNFGLVETIDLAPTILRLAGLPEEDEFSELEGADLATSAGRKQITLCSPFNRAEVTRLGDRFDFQSAEYDWARR